MPTSEKKIAANRANAQKSTGPKTAEGKARSSRNATCHGLNSKEAVIQNENPDEFEALRRDLLDAYRPADAAESTLVEEVAACFWRLKRVRSMETEAFKLHCRMSDPILGFGCGEADFDRIRRYMSTIERAYHRAIDKLQQTQRLRAARECGPEVGFVSQTPVRPLYSATPDELDDLKPGALLDLRLPPRRLPDDLPVQLDRHPLPVNPEPFKQPQNRQPAGYSAIFAVDRYPDGLTPFFQRHTI